MRIYKNEDDLTKTIVESDGGNGVIDDNYIRTDNKDETMNDGMTFTDKQFKALDEKNIYSFLIFKDVFNDADVSFKDLWKFKMTREMYNPYFRCYNSSELFIYLMLVILTIISPSPYIGGAFLSLLLISIIAKYTAEKYYFLKKERQKLASLEKEL